MPAVSAAGTAAVDADESGIASGVINASRQAGGAFGIAVLAFVGLRARTGAASINPATYADGPAVSRP
jgi:MFS transporter, DHA2 family, methylenomycin A resistance protein